MRTALLTAVLLTAIKAQNSAVCPPVTVILQPVFYSEVIPVTTTIDPFRNGHSITVSQVPSTVVTAAVLSRTIYPNWYSVSIKPYWPITDTQLATSATIIARSESSAAGSADLSSTAKPSLSQSVGLTVGTTKSIVRSVNTANRQRSSSSTNSPSTFTPTPVRSVSFNSVSDAPSASPDPPFYSALAFNQGLEEYFSDPNIELKSLPEDVFVVLAISVDIDVSVNDRAGRAGGAIFPRQESGSSIDLVNLGNVTLTDTVHQDSCDQASPLSLRDGRLVHYNESIAKPEFARMARFNKYEQSPEMVDTVFSLKGGFLQWLATDLDQTASFFGCDDGMYVAFGEDPSDESCVPLAVGAIAGSVCQQRVERTREVEEVFQVPTGTPPTTSPDPTSVEDRTTTTEDPVSTEDPKSSTSVRKPATTPSPETTVLPSVTPADSTTFSAAPVPSSSSSGTLHRSSTSISSSVRREPISSPSVVTTPPIIVPSSIQSTVSPSSGQSRQDSSSSALLQPTSSRTRSRFSSGSTGQDTSASTKDAQITASTQTVVVSSTELPNSDATSLSQNRTSDRVTSSTAQTSRLQDPNESEIISQSPSASSSRTSRSRSSSNPSDLSATTAETNLSSQLAISSSLSTSSTSQTAYFTSSESSDTSHLISRTASTTLLSASATVTSIASSISSVFLTSTVYTSDSRPTSSSTATQETSYASFRSAPGGNTTTSSSAEGSTLSPFTNKDTSKEAETSAMTSSSAFSRLQPSLTESFHSDSSTTTSSKGDETSVVASDISSTAVTDVSTSFVGTSFSSSKEAFTSYSSSEEAFEPSTSSTAVFTSTSESATDFLVQSDECSSSTELSTISTWEASIISEQTSENSSPIATSSALFTESSVDSTNVSTVPSTFSATIARDNSSSTLEQSSSPWWTNTSSTAEPTPSTWMNSSSAAGTNTSAHSRTSTFQESPTSVWTVTSSFGKELTTMMMSDASMSAMILDTTVISTTTASMMTSDSSIASSSTEEGSGASISSSEAVSETASTVSSEKASESTSSASSEIDPGHGTSTASVYEPVTTTLASSSETEPVTTTLASSETEPVSSSWSDVETSVPTSPMTSSNNENSPTTSEATSLSEVISTSAANTTLFDASTTAGTPTFTNPDLTTSSVAEYESTTSTDAVTTGQYYTSTTTSDIVTTSSSAVPTPVEAVAQRCDDRRDVKVGAVTYDMCPSLNREGTTLDTIGATTAETELDCAGACTADPLCYGFEFDTSIQGVACTLKGLAIAGDSDPGRASNLHVSGLRINGQRIGVDPPPDVCADTITPTIAVRDRGRHFAVCEDTDLAGRSGLTGLPKQYGGTQIGCMNKCADEDACYWWVWTKPVVGPPEAAARCDIYVLPDLFPKPGIIMGLGRAWRETNSSSSTTTAVSASSSASPETSSTQTPDATSQTTSAQTTDATSSATSNPNACVEGQTLESDDEITSFQLRCNRSRGGPNLGSLITGGTRKECVEDCSAILECFAFNYLPPSDAPQLSSCQLKGYSTLSYGDGYSNGLRIPIARSIDAYSPMFCVNKRDDYATNDGPAVRFAVCDYAIRGSLGQDFQDFPDNSLQRCINLCASMPDCVYWNVLHYTNHNGYGTCYWYTVPNSGGNYGYQTGLLGILSELPD